jgi:hypothetical protein
VTLRDRERELPAKTGELGRRLLAPGDPYRVIGEQLAEVIRNGDFAERDEPTGPCS